MKSHVGNKYLGTAVVLDGNEFRDCTFKNCILVYRGGKLPRLIGNVIGDCQFRLEDGAIRTIQFLNSLHLVGAHQVVDDYIMAIRGEGQQAPPSSTKTTH